MEQGRAREGPEGVELDDPRAPRPRRVAAGHHDEVDHDAPRGAGEAQQPGPGLFKALQDCENGASGALFRACEGVSAWEKVRGGGGGGQMRAINASVLMVFGIFLEFFGMSFCFWNFFLERIFLEFFWNFLG